MGANRALQRRRNHSVDYVERRADRIAAASEHQSPRPPSREAREPSAPTSASAPIERLQRDQHQQRHGVNAAVRTELRAGDRDRAAADRGVQRSLHLLRVGSR